MDREKVIKGFEICVDRVPGKYNCNECPYEIDGNYCEINLAKDALALLKQEAVVRCKDCKHYIHVRTDAIGHCTKDISCWVFRDMDWFCADGERRVDDA